MLKQIWAWLQQKIPLYIQQQEPRALLPPAYQTKFLKISDLNHLRLEKGLKPSNSTHFKMEMGQTKKVFENHQIQSIFLVHGTFVGDDPFGVLKILENTMGNRAAHLRKGYRIFFEKNKAKIYGDMGNFTTEYLGDCLAGMGKSFKGRLFSWSSGNHHLARVLGTLDLVKSLEAQICETNQKGIILLGHSHGGNLFALLSQFTNNLTLTKQIIDTVTNEQNEFKDYDYLNALKKISQHKLFFVTFGTPVRYQWSLRKNTKALHIINHRVKNFPESSLKDIIKTTSGDYIQLLGTSSVDIRGGTTQLREINHVLGEMLESHQSALSIKEVLKEGKRHHNQGDTILMDYQDNSSIPNFAASRLGHSIYTRSDLMLCHFKLIRDWLNSLE